MLLSPGLLQLFWEISGSSVGSSASTKPAACALHRQAPPQQAQGFGEATVQVQQHRPQSALCFFPSWISL